MHRIKTYIVDSFTDEPFKGNPAGVCLVERELPDETMHSIAKELGLSETAFIKQLPKEDKYSIRYFSPKMEIPLCGHATLAGAKVLFIENTRMNNIHFVNMQGLELPVRKNGDEIIMEFPIYQIIPQNAPRELLVALGIEKIINSAYNHETKILLLEIEHCSILRSMKPDFEKLLKAHDGINGVLVTALSDEPNYDFESRYFWPWSGTNEDPVTGGTHTFLAKYWSDRLHKKKLRSFQCSERSGFMEVELISEYMLTIKSKAAIILKGELTV